MKPIKVRIETASEHSSRFRAAIANGNWKTGAFPKQFLILWNGRIVGMRETQGDAMHAAQEFAVMTYHAAQPLFGEVSLADSGYPNVPGSRGQG